MKNRKFLVSPILVYVLGQVAWMALLGLWITWYVANVISGRASGGGVLDLTTTVFVLGLVFLSALLAGMTLTFISFAQQVNINRTYDNFLASVTHELKSPLASIRLHLETLAFRKLNREHEQSLVALMVRDTTRLEKLITTILEIASFEHHGKSHKLDQYAAEELIPRIVEQTMADFRIVDWNIDMTACRDARINADPSALKRVLDILVDNSVKYTVGDARINLNCASRRKSLVIELADTGIGIPKESLRKVFRKFYRVERESSPTITGTGLGLYWARELIRIHRGSIAAESGASSTGTLFRITLPLARRTSFPAGQERS